MIHDPMTTIPSTCRACGRDLPAVEVTTPLEVLRHAREAVRAGTFTTAHLAIGNETAFVAVHGGPRTRAWSMILETFDEPRTAEGADRAAERYYAVSQHNEVPDREGELQVLDAAVVLAGAYERQLDTLVRKWLRQGIYRHALANTAQAVLGASTADVAEAVRRVEAMCGTHPWEDDEQNGEVMRLRIGETLYTARAERAYASDKWCARLYRGDDQVPVSSDRWTWHSSLADAKASYDELLATYSFNPHASRRAADPLAEACTKCKAEVGQLCVPQVERGESSAERALALRLRGSREVDEPSEATMDLLFPWKDDDGS